MKHLRHSTIRDILENTSVVNQDDLRKKLAARGFHVTQATLSRDIRSLKLSKGPSGYTLESSGNGMGNSEDEGPGTRDVLRGFGLEVRQALNLLVLITTTGGAQPVAAGIDYEDWAEVVGTIAGDDTVLVICADEKRATTLRARIEDYIG